MITVAALFVAERGCYTNLEDVDAWPESRDARLYAGPHPVVAHPPCQRWGRYWFGGPSAKVRRIKGDDGGCFESALASVRRWGGVLEHPEASHAWAQFGLARPPKTGGWLGLICGGFTCCVEQGHYGHRARKATWLYLHPGVDGWSGLMFPGLFWAIKWGPSVGERLDEGFHSKAERDAARVAGIKPRPRLSTRENIATPLPFRDLLLSMARSVRGATNG